MRYQIVVLLLLVSVASFSQKTTLFHDAFGVKGAFKFNGDFSDSLLPKQGPVEVRWREVDSLFLKTYRIKGQTRNHIPTGSWIWEEANWDYKINIGRSIQPTFQSAGQRMKWEGSFVNGKPNGKWVFTLDSVSASGNSTGVLVRMEMILKNGQPAGSISIQNDIEGCYFKMKGLCDDYGIVKNNWIYEYKNDLGATIKEEHVYNKGLLLEVKVFMDTLVSTTSFDRNKSFIQKAKDLVEIEGKRIGEVRFEHDEFDGVSADLFSRHFKGYFLNGWNLNVFPFNIELGTPIFKQLEYPLNDVEKSDIAYCRDQIKEQRKSINEHLDGSIFIHRSRSGELDTSIAFLELQLIRINFIDSLLNRTELPYFTYKHRYEQGVLHWLQGLNELRHAKGEVYDSLMLSLPEVKVESDTLKIFHELKKIVLRNQHDLPKYYDIVENARLSLKREGELKELEVVLEGRFKKTQDFYSTAVGIGEEINNKWVKGELQRRLQAYAREDNYEEALRIGNKMITILDSLEKWQPMINEFNTMEDVLNAQYRYLVYNPYTGENDIEVRVKKRFLSNILNNLWPCMTKQLENESEWESWVVLWNQQFDVFYFLLNFANRDDGQAKRVERRIRKEKKTDRMLKIILNQIDGSSEVSFLRK